MDRRALAAVLWVSDSGEPVKTLNLLLLPLALLIIVLSCGTGAFASGPDADFVESGTSITYEQLVDGFGYAVIGSNVHERIIAPGDFGRDFLPVNWCESGYQSIRVGLLGELGQLQIYPKYHQGPMEAAGLSIYVEHDRLLWAIGLWRAYQWRPWSCRP